VEGVGPAQHDATFARHAKPTRATSVKITNGPPRRACVSARFGWQSPFRSSPHALHLFRVYKTGRRRPGVGIGGARAAGASVLPPPAAAGSGSAYVRDGEREDLVPTAHLHDARPAAVWIDDLSLRAGASEPAVLDGRRSRLLDLAPQPPEYAWQSNIRERAGTGCACVEVMGILRGRIMAAEGVVTVSEHPSCGSGGDTLDWRGPQVRSHARRPVGDKNRASGATGLLGDRPPGEA
jgi:hypothetical protein